MTYEELLAKIDAITGVQYNEPTGTITYGNAYGYVRSKTNQALRAVVELHKPISCGCGRWDCEAKLCGSICGKVGIYYPCPTIQAIEKELN